MSTVTLRTPASRIGDPRLAEKLRKNLAGEVLFAPADRARYATDASIYHIEPVGVVCPKNLDELAIALAIAREEGISVIARGAGTSQAGQTVGRSLILDCSRWLTSIRDLDLEARTVRVEPGLVLDELNRFLKPYGLFYPVDVSTSSRATIGGMTANNACGARSLAYGASIDNVLAIEALLADGTVCSFGPSPASFEISGSAASTRIVNGLQAIARAVREDVAARWPRTARQVGGYALDRIDPDGPFNPASILVGSEGTLALFRSITVKLQPLPAHRVLGVCHFPDFASAMHAAPRLVELGPTCVELVDRTILELARAIPAFAETLPAFVRGAPDCLLLVEFAGEELAPLERSLRALAEAMAELGHPDSLVEAKSAALQARIAHLRTAGLNIVMSMRTAGKPVSFIEDCTVLVERLAEYTAALEELFARHGTKGTWYAHAGAGCLHVRPVLNLRLEKDRKALRAIAEEAVELVRRMKGTHSGEHGDGIVRSEWHERVFGPGLVRAFERVKDLFDPAGVLNTAPSKIVRAPRMDEPALLRWRRDDRSIALRTGLDWSAWGGVLGAAEMCNNNGACRSLAGGVMCPSYRATREEKDSTRGRANLLRDLLLGRLGSWEHGQDALEEALDLCVACKACRRECPTGVDMARMKIELRHQRRLRSGLRARDRLVASLPRWAPWGPLLDPLLAARERSLVLARAGERLFGLAADRPLPRFARAPWRGSRERPNGRGEGLVALFADCFTRWFEPENARASERLLAAAGLRPVDATPKGARPLCCGRTYLAAGKIEEARRELRRSLGALRAWQEAGVPIVGLEPSCLLTFRDEVEALLPEKERAGLDGVVRHLAEFLTAERRAGRLDLPLRPLAGRILVHGHCHEKAFGLMGAVLEALRLVPGARIEPIESSCCGMAGSFGYEAEHRAISRAMAEAALLPAVRAAENDAILVADGTSCRHQIRDGTGRTARHLAMVLAEALP
ncbi:MAG: FAD-linked oxidase C-terminal domain-containing protein [Geminicoccaceae bacterium]|nr:FAD-linked oxidase C-terminal domain-containing protein [Geminicoccaceae bacterium]